MPQREGLAVVSLDLSFELEQQRVAFSVQCFACRNFDPTFADAVFLYVSSFFPIEFDAHIVLKHFRQVVGAARVNGEVVGQGRALR